MKSFAKVEVKPGGIRNRKRAKKEGDRSPLSFSALSFVTPSGFKPETY